MVLDRYVNIGSFGHPLASDGPSRNEVLPSDDAPWDQGEMVTSEPIFVSSATSVKAGPFARTCQAAHLVGRVVVHKNDRSLDSPFRFSEAVQLHRTIIALASLLPSEFETAPERLSTAMALCYSAMLALYDPYSCTESNEGEHTVEETEMQGIAISGLQATADEVLRFAQHLKRTMTYDLAAISPLIADSLYGAASTYAWLASERGTPEMVASYNNLVEALRLLDMRWKVAGEYIRMLETSDYANHQQTTQASYGV
ncbi:putative fungal specific transcription factor domain protein [Phaeomoniella chlamydospora]|uniref:Putative fungal specific transcription factor domain protein n=1 Tax=Phaeomoniella chlamydospora TaxID=158046 RepID=A0A0G2E941_PHACM|nr:putative fungal specific transcription factor domain protein [Phaeomoniella chlamydospora]